MKKNKFTIIIATILGITSFWFYTNNGKSSLDSSMRHFAISAVSTIDKVVLTGPQKTVTIEQSNEVGWLINDSYPANKNRLSALMYVLENIDVKVPVSKHDYDSVKTALLSECVRCDIYQQNKLSKTYYIGGNSVKGGTYMLLVDAGSKEPSSTAFVTYIPGVDQNLSPKYSVDEKFWREHVLFQYGKNTIQSVKMEVPSFSEAGYELSIDVENNYSITMLADKRKVDSIDSLSVNQYLSYFQQISFESFRSGLTNAQFTSIVDSQPLNILTVVDKAGNQKIVRFYPAMDYKSDDITIDPDRMLATFNNGKDIVVVKFYEVGKVMPPVRYFQLKKK